MGKKRNYTDYSKISSEQVAPEVTEEVVEPVVETAEPTIEEEVVEPPVEPIDGVVINCARLRVRKEPRVDAEVLCEIKEGSEVLINTEESTEEFYKVYTAAGVEGYCVKTYIEVNS